jgi:hypothetical protein
MKKKVFNIDKVYLKKKNKIKLITFLMFLICFSFFLINFNVNIIHNNKNEQNFTSYNTKEKDIETSSIVGFINLTNYWIDGKTFSHNHNFTVEGDLNRTSGSESGHIIAIVIDGVIIDQYNDTTDGDGNFSIEYNVSDSLNVYSSHTVNVSVIFNPGIVGDFIYENYFSFNVNTTSYFDINRIGAPYSPGEEYNVNGFIRYGNGTGISSRDFQYRWENLSDTWPINTLPLGIDGSLPSIPVPDNASLGRLNLSLFFPEISGSVESSQALIENIDIFNNITVSWDTPTEGTEAQILWISGQISAMGNNSLKISNREFNLIFDGELIGIVTTDSQGIFNFNYMLPLGTGSKIIRIQLQGNPTLESNYNITISQNNLFFLFFLPTPEEGLTISAFQWFLMIGVPGIIIAGIIIAIMAFLYYRKNVISSQVVTIPLEQKIENLKILKESGRMEEALTYLFNAIYMELVGGKYGRRRSPNETIRDFGIISVKEFGLDPTKIYPFIQKIESIIYSRPSPLSEDEFYQSIELFSPIYYSITGYNFILNF